MGRKENLMIERAKQRIKLLRPLLIPFVLYVGLLAFSVRWLEANPESAWRVLVALTPMLPGIFIVAGVVRAIWQLDEMERMVLLQGIVVSFVGTLVLVMSLGFLEMAGVPQVPMTYIALFMALLWLVAKLWIQRRYE
jgi:hypothetical protein